MHIYICIYIYIYLNNLIAYISCINHINKLIPVFLNNYLLFLANHKCILLSWNFRLTHY